MPNYRGRRAGTRRVVIWKDNKAHEWIVDGTKADGDRFEAAKRIEIEAHPVTATRTVPTFFEFSAEHYQPHAEQHLKASTWNVRRYQLANLIAFFGPMKLTQIGTRECETYKRTNLGRVRKVKHRTYKAGAVGLNNELRVLGKVLNYAKELGYPVSALKTKRLPVRGRGRIRAWTAPELAKLWEACRKESPALLPLLIFLVNTGCRKGEGIAAEWPWMDLEKGMVRIPSNEYWQPKNGLPREVPMSDAVRAILSGERRSPTWVFATRSKRRFSRFPEKTFTKVRDMAGLTGGPHQLRHTFAAHFLQAVPDLFLLSQILGHSHQRVTELYAHLLPDHLGRARNAVNLAPTMAVTMAKRSTPRKKTAKTA